MGPPSLRDRRIRSPVARSGKMADRASNAPQGMRERKTGAAILEKMPGHEWLSCTSISRLIGANDGRKTRARLDRLVLDGRVERKRERGVHGFVYLYRQLT
jgi:hypothetical protein